MDSKRGYEQVNKYIATGNVITNRIIFTDKRVVEGIMGGHGLYAHEGISLGTDNCIFVASVGKDFDEYYGKWFDDNHMSKEGLKFNLERCNYNEVVYAEDGQFIEYSIDGPEEEEKNRALSYMTCDDIEPFLEGKWEGRRDGLYRHYGYLFSQSPGKLCTLRCGQ